MPKPDLCDRCEQGVSDCATFGCLCGVCGEPPEDHTLWLVELPVSPQQHGLGPLCPGRQLDNLDIYTEREED